MQSSSFDFSPFINAIADRVAEKLAGREVASERVAVDAAAQHGAPSASWLQTQARLGRITIQGPRGARFVMRADLEALIRASTIRRKPAAPSPSVDGDAKAAVAELAARRAGGK